MLLENNCINCLIWLLLMNINVFFLFGIWSVFVFVRKFVIVEYDFDGFFKNVKMCKVKNG